MIYRIYFYFALTKQIHWIDFEGDWLDVSLCVGQGFWIDEDRQYSKFSEARSRFFITPCNQRYVEKIPISGDKSTSMN